MDVRSQLNGGNALLVAGNKVHGDEPLAKGNLRVLEDGSDGDGEVRLAMVAVESSVGAARTVMMSAEGADNILLVPTGLEDCPAAFVLGVEVLGEFEYGIEVRKVNHKPKFECIYIIIP